MRDAVLGAARLQDGPRDELFRDELPEDDEASSGEGVPLAL